MTRSAKVRTSGASLLLEGSGEDYGWLSNFAAGTLGDYSPYSGRPSWWVGHDRFDGSPVGPTLGGFGADPRAGLPHGGWWNRPDDAAGLLPAVTRATTVIVNPIVRTPWQTHTDDMQETPLPRWVTDPMMRRAVPGPNLPSFPWGQRLSGAEFWSTFLTHAIWFGLGAFLAVERSDGSPLQGSLRIVNPYLVGLEDGRWVLDPHGEHPAVTDFDGRIQIGGVTWRLYTMLGLTPNDPANPAGVLTRHFDTLRLGVNIHTFQMGQFGNGVPAGYLKVVQPNFSEEKAAALKRTWLDAHGGARKSIAVLNAQVDFTPVTVKAVDAETTALKTANLVDVAHMFGLSSTWLDTSAGYSLTYANAVDKRREILDFSLTGWGQQFMEALNVCLPDRQQLRIQWDKFTAPSLAEQIPVLVQAVAAGLLDVEEARGYMGLMPKGGR
jgi:hypothetical protein